MDIRSVLHDLNNALMTVAGNAECLAASRPAGVDAAAEVAAIQEASARAVRLARELREWVRVNASAPSPDRDAPEGAGVHAPLRPSLADSRCAARRIVVVDDQPAVRRSVAEMLEALGHTVVAAASAHDALASIEEGPCDLVVTDLAMPDMSGLALASEVRRIRPGLPVVLLTGGETPCEVRPDVIRLVLVKPVSLTVLRDAVIRAAA